MRGVGWDGRRRRKCQGGNLGTQGGQRKGNLFTGKKSEAL